MRNTTLARIPLFALLVGLAGCGGTDSLPTPVGPSTVPPQVVVPPAGDWLDGYTLTGVSLSGTVYESTAAGPMPIAGALVYCELCGELTHTWASADANGLYSFSGDIANGGGVWLSPGQRTTVSVRADGYHDPNDRLGRREVMVVGDTRLDFELVRR